NAGVRRQCGARSGGHLQIPDAPCRWTRGRPRVLRGVPEGAWGVGIGVECLCRRPLSAASGGGRIVNADELIQIGRKVVRVEADAMAELEARLGGEFARAVQLIAESPGRVIVAGVGKSGLIGRKIAATLTSTGTAAAFLHPVDSVHGDLGVVGADDVAILLSKSGESDELIGLLAHLKGFGVRTIAITGVPTSALAR